MRRNYVSWLADTWLFSSDDSAEYGHNVNINTTDDLFRVVQVGRASNIRGEKGKEMMQINKSISGIESCTLYKKEGQKSLNLKRLRLSGMKM